MKLIIILCLTLTTTQALAKKVYEKLEDKKYYFSALNVFFKEAHVRKVTERDVQELDRLLTHTGIEVLMDYESSVLEKYPNPSTQFVLARKSMESKNYPKAMEYINRMPSGHHYFPEAQLMKAQIFAEQNEAGLEYRAFTECYNAAIKNSGNKDKDIDHYFKVLAETCLAGRARVKYEMGRYKEAIEAYNKFPKNTYKWPYLLLERAWAYYKIGDFNRALGLLVTYKSPLMDTYFFPEAEYLTALIYYRLCLFNDSTIIINHYDKYYRPRFNALEKVLRENKSSKTYFFNLMFKKNRNIEKHGDFVKHIITRLKKQSRFSLGVRSIRTLNNERKLIKWKENKKIQRMLLPHLNEVNKNMIYNLNAIARAEIFNFLDNVRFFSAELFKINLEIVSHTKELIYDNKKLISDRSRGDLSNVQRSRFEYFWTFEKAFWADELGDYSFGLKSNCETVSKEQK
jgi:tetratricopeptide (TPR) repeat protein